MADAAFRAACVKQFEIIQEQCGSLLKKRLRPYFASNRQTNELAFKLIEDRGASLDPDALEQAVAATSGYAFMVQLVGFHSWVAAADSASRIGLTEVTAGISKARRRIGRLVLAPT